MNYLIVCRINGGYQIKADMDYNPSKYELFRYYGFTKKQAIKAYREQFNLRFRHLTLIDC